MNKESATTEALEGEYIAAGEPEHTFTTGDPISDSMRDALKPGAGAAAFAEAQRRQAEGMRNVGMGGQQGAAQSSGLAGLGGFGMGILYGFK
jgi:hypothetical protein